MNNTLRFALAAAAVVAALVGLTYFVAPNVGSPGPDPSSTVPPDPTPTPAALDQPEGPLARVPISSTTIEPMRITIAVPEGWQNDTRPGGGLDVQLRGAPRIRDRRQCLLRPMLIGIGLADPAVGPTVDDLVSAPAGPARRSRSAPRRM